MSRLDKESGHALIEAMLLGLVFMVPLLWLLSVSAEIHGAVLGTSSAAREAGFEAGRSVDAISADRHVSEIVAQSVADHGLEPERARVQWVPAPGWRRGGTVEVVVSYRVPVFQFPLLGEIGEPTVVVSGRHIATIDRYRSRG